jgi:lipocalin-like protein
MLSFVRPILLLVALVAAHKSFADDPARLQGAWKLLSYTVEYQATGGKEAVMGEKPIGYAIFTPEGRAMFVITGEGRKPETDDKGRAALLNTLIAYTGRYRIEGDRWITKVEVAWNPEWVGSDQERFFRLDGNRLEVATPWRIMPNWPEKGMTRSVLTFERSK